MTTRTTIDRSAEGSAEGVHTGLHRPHTPGVLREDFPDLLARAQRGDEVAFSRLWSDLNPALLRYLRLEPQHSADDLAAETWVSVVRGLSRFRGDETAWRAWVFTTARRRAVDEGRRRARRPRSLSADHLDDLPAVPDHHDDLTDALALLALLPAAQAEVVALRVIAGLPVETVATMVGKSPGAVRVASHRGLRTLASLLSTQDVTSEPG